MHGQQITYAMDKMNIGLNILDESLRGQNKLGHNNRPPGRLKVMFSKDIFFQEFFKKQKSYYSNKK